jgi:hypothetical protein
MPIVVSLPKSGTNLISRCVEALGYRAIGAGIRRSYAGIFTTVGGERSERAASNPRREDVLADSAVLIRLGLDSDDGRTCVFVHGLPCRGSLTDSCLGRDGPVIFNYRDPRAVMVSLVHYLTQGAREAFTPLSGFMELARVLSRLPSSDRRLTFLMTYAPNYVGDAFRTNAWLLRHSDVLRLRYESLVGPAGGGSEAAQLASIDAIATSLGVRCDPAAIARSLYETTSRTFRTGTIDGWRHEFTAEIERQFRRLYSDILDAYGYA